MPPPRAAYADAIEPVARVFPEASLDQPSLDQPSLDQSFPDQSSPEQPSPEALAAAIRDFLEAYPEASVLEDGAVLFELKSSSFSLQIANDRCTLQLWSGDRHLVRTILAVEPRKGSLRITTERFGHRQTKLLHLVAEAQRSTAAKKQPARKAYLKVLERVLTREFPDWKTDTFRAAMDLERSFGPAYVRGSLVNGKQAWAVIGVGAAESQAVIDGVLTLGILWLHHCRERSAGTRLYKGLRVIVPRGAATLTLSRLPWLNNAAAAWELFELDEGTEELAPRDAADQGNLRTRLVHHPDIESARERFEPAIAEVMRLVPRGEHPRVEQRLRSSSELHFLLHGFEFARVRLAPTPGSFNHVLEITAGHGATQTVLTAGNRAAVQANITELFQRRDPGIVQAARTLRQVPSSRTIGPFTGRPAHARIEAAVHIPGMGVRRLEQRERALGAQADPLFRAAPERWLEAVLRENLSPLTRSIAPPPTHAPHIAKREQFANDLDPDTRGNRLDTVEDEPWRPARAPISHGSERDKLIPHFDPRFVYAQVPAIAGASDRGMLDLLGVTTDGRLAVIELKASDDLQLALQGLDYWIRVRQHHLCSNDTQSNSAHMSSDLQRHGYFRAVELSPLPPRLYLVAPALHIHPATETVLRYLAPSVEWALLALDERWRQKVQVVWRKSGGRLSAV